jgi:hypothetical protein
MRAPIAQGDRDLVIAVDQRRLLVFSLGCRLAAHANGQESGVPLLIDRRHALGVGHNQQQVRITTE